MPNRQQTHPDDTESMDNEQFLDDQVDAMSQEELSDEANGRYQRRNLKRQRVEDSDAEPAR